MPRVALKDYRALASFRYEIRRFLAFSERAARSAGIEPQQHQALLSLQGLPSDLRPTIGTLAERLCVEHHTAVALVDKLVERNFAVRERSETDRREVLVRLTPAGLSILKELAAMHREQIGTVGPRMVAALTTVLGSVAPPPPPPKAKKAAPAPRPRKATTTKKAAKSSKKASPPEAPKSSRAARSSKATPRGSATAPPRGAASGPAKKRAR